ncbi:PLP-dependent transferase [Pseudomonas syringae group genomosp. 7]|uniref:PLP-dependent transferase n=1 Tax=Pseudomonas syringae group genomosp. 7 TaxID=251699 RepID=UPI001F4C3131|nr:PLP-dependent transferase [Pseudomonas syringae group genomosp. 7]UNB60916.1 PLP-dependent transferase [Pseudomonas syringae pv. helianthi]
MSKAFGERVEQVRHTPHVSASELAQWQARGEPLVVLDGRPFDEYRKMTIPGSVCCPNGELGYRIPELVSDDSTPIVVNCAGRTRSIIGAQTLIDMGLKNPVYALENGTQGWYLADLQLEHGSSRRYPDKVSPAAVALQRNAADLLAKRAQVQTVTAEQVRRWAADSARSLFLCDVRSAEEFAAGSLPGAPHTPGGQLIQATDLYVGVRNARLVVLDSDGVRAPIVASWLRQLGHDACVLADGVDSGLSLPMMLPYGAARHEPVVDVPAIGVQALADALKDDAVALIDLRSSTRYRKAHIDGARWSIRPLLASALAAEARPVVLVANDLRIAQLAVEELPLTQRRQVRLLEGGVDAWQAAGLPLREDGASLVDEQCIDFLFFTHDRHSGNKDAARQYLAWEIGLLGQMSEEELACFKPLQPVHATCPQRDPLVRTRLVHAARTAKGSGVRAVNVPVTRLSTVLFDSLSEMRDIRKRRDSERLLTDAVYSPIRRVAQEFLRPFGIEVSYYAADGQGLEAQLQDNTRMVYAEVPGSLLYELCDLPAIADLCRPGGILLAVDNTWGSGYLYRPLELGADISIMALTKYLCGHSDVVMGSVCTREEVWPPLGRMGDTLGNAVSPDDAWLILRGARTLASRMQVHERQALDIAVWLDAHPQVGRVFHPGLPGHPQHSLWKRDFNGSNGLLSFELRDENPALAERFIGALQLFGLGASWGGYESLVTVAEVATRRREQGRPLNTVLRLHIGLEDVSALIDDLQRGCKACLEKGVHG